MEGQGGEGPLSIDSQPEVEFLCGEVLFNSCVLLYLDLIGLGLHLSSGNV